MNGIAVEARDGFPGMASYLINGVSTLDLITSYADNTTYINVFLADRKAT